MYEMSEWIKVDSFFFSGENGFINIDGAYQVINFENDFMEARHFDVGKVFDGDRSQGEVDVALSYKLISDKLLSIQNDRDSILEITELQLWGGIPIISLEFTSGGYNLSHLEGTYIPTEFIYFTRESFGDNSIIGYHIKHEYFDSRVDRFYKFATSIIEATYVDFDVSILLESLHPIYRDEFENNEEEEFKTELSEVLSDYEDKYAENIEYRIGRWDLKNTDDNEEVSFFRYEAGNLITSLKEMGYDVDAAGVFDVSIRVDEETVFFELGIVEMGSKMYYINLDFMVEL